MDPFALLVGAFTTIVAITTFLSALYVGSRRGVRDTSVRLSAEQSALITVLQSRVEALVEENKRQAEAMGAMQLELAKLRAELDVEKKITARIGSMQGGSST